MIKVILFSFENLRGIVRRSKVEILANSVATDLSIYVVKVDSSSKIIQSNKVAFSFFAVAANDRGYGHGRFAGVFAVAQRQSECGRKTR